MPADALPRQLSFNIPRIIAAAAITGAARFTGLRLPRENAEFADIVRTSNITFVGPSGDQIRQMGDKAAARKLAQKLKVPTVPGSPGRSRTRGGTERSRRRSASR